MFPLFLPFWADF